MNENEWVAKVSGLVSRLDATEQMIFMVALPALASKGFTVDQFTEWAGRRIERHRAGEVLHLSDPETEVAA